MKTTLKFLGVGAYSLGTVLTGLGSVIIGAYIASPEYIKQNTYLDPTFSISPLLLFGGVFLFLKGYYLNTLSENTDGIEKLIK